MGYVKYSPQLKVIAVHKFLSGQTPKAINIDLTTDISDKSFVRWHALYTHTHAVVRDPATYERRGRPTLYTDEDREFMLELIENDPCMFLDEIQEAMYDHTDLLACRQTIANDLKERLLLTIHKVSKVDPNQSSVLQAKFCASVANIPSGYLVFLDETGLKLPDVQRNHVRSKKGERPKALKRSRHGIHYSVLAVICEMGLLAVNSKVNAYRRNEFEAFLKHVLLPVMQPYPNRNSVLVMDNATIHHRGSIEALCEDAGVLLIYTSPCSPEFNPIERVFDIFKASLRRNGLLAVAQDKLKCLKQVMSDVCTSNFIISLYKACGYRPRDQ